MRRVIGVALIVLGILPITALAAVAFWTWARHIYTIGLTVDAQGASALIGIGMADLLCVCAGVYLVSGARRQL